LNGLGADVIYLFDVRG